MLDRLARASLYCLGFDAFCLNKKFLVLNLVDRNLKIKYRRSFLGFFWTILSPLTMSVIYYFVFKVVLKVQREHFLAFIISGVLPWNFFVQTLGESTESIVGNAGLLSKIPIPVHVFPYVTSITNFATLALSLPVLLGAALVTGAHLTPSAIWILYFYATLMLLTYAMGAILSILFVYMRDLRHALGLILQLWFYGTPVLYDSTMIPEKFRFILYLNPVGTIFEGIHISFIQGVRPPLHIIGVSAGWCIFTFILLRVTHGYLRPGLVERI